MVRDSLKEVVVSSWRADKDATTTYRRGLDYTKNSMRGASGEDVMEAIGYINGFCDAIAEAQEQ